MQGLTTPLGPARFETDPRPERGLQAHALHHAPAVFVWKAGRWLQRAARGMDAWLAARAKAREDAQCLEAMSDRELRDIGIDPARIHPAAWTKDWTV